MHALGLEDAAIIFERFQKIDLKLTWVSVDEIQYWLYFMVDLFMLEHYYTLYKGYKKSNKSGELNDFKVKYCDLYIKIVHQYQDFYERIISKHYKSEYSFLYESDADGFLYDIMTLNREIIQYDLLTLNSIKGNPHEKLIFCYKYFITGWNSKDILYKLRKKTLNKLFINFINDYSMQSDLPQVVVLCYFYPLEEQLHKSAKDLTRLNQYFTNIDIRNFLKIDKTDKQQFIRNTISKRVNVIDKWCNRIREKIINDTIELLQKSKLG